jgi:hypothetical protein
MTTDAADAAPRIGRPMELSFELVVFVTVDGLMVDDAVGGSIAPGLCGAANTVEQR